MIQSFYCLKSGAACCFLILYTLFGADGSQSGNNGKLVTAFFVMKGMVRYFLRIMLTKLLPHTILVMFVLGCQELISGLPSRH